MKERRLTPWFVAAVLTTTTATTASAFLHDADHDGIDDRIQAVVRDGREAAFENRDVESRLRIAIFDDATARGAVEFGVYVGYDHAPTETDLAELEELGLTGLKAYRYIDYVRARADYDAITEIASRRGVVRVEAIPMVYATNHYGSRTVRARASHGLTVAERYALFPSAREELGLDGTGVVVAVLDTGVNDDVDVVNPLYPGHESLAGKFLGGGEFYFGDPLLNTGLDDSMNPQDHGSAASSYHATHVAGSAIGNGGPDGTFTGVAPAARLVDCKVLSDAGLGFGSADGVEWCIHNMTNDWGLEGDDLVYAGIDVLNLSLGGLDASDGTDAGSQMINAAVEAGLIVCIATGNDGEVDWIASPAAADHAIAVGASSHERTLDRTDDQVTDFSNEGPRADDGDADHLDEMKPAVVAPGAGILSANGDFTTEGGAYVGLSGTSMSTPHVAGVCALLRQADPSLGGLDARAILQNTAIHAIPSVKGDRPDDPFGIDPNYDPGCGWGLVDAYAAAREVMNATDGVQVVRIAGTHDAGAGANVISWWTQREHSFEGFDVYRADDVDGAPGAFTKITDALIAPVGDPTIDGDDNRTPYTHVDDDPALEDGERYWYRVDWVDDLLASHPEPPLPVRFGAQPALATVRYAIQHNTPDNDLSIRIGTSDPAAPEFFVLGLGEAQQDSFLVHEPANEATAILGYVEHFWTVVLTEDELTTPGLLPPSSDQRWFLDIVEGGYVNRQGSANAFELFVHDEPGSEDGFLYVTNSPVPQPTVEGLATTLWIPDPLVIGVPDGTPTTVSSLAPTTNPFRGTGVVRFAIGPDQAGANVRLTVHDATGRELRRLVDGALAEGIHRASWDGRDAGGRVVATGVYFLTLRAGSTVHTTKVTRLR